MLCQHVHRFRPLQRKQNTVIGARQHRFALKCRLKQRPVLMLHRAIDHDIQRALRLIAERVRGRRIAEIMVERHEVGADDADAPEDDETDVLRETLSLAPSRGEDG